MIRSTVYWVLMSVGLLAAPWSVAETIEPGGCRNGHFPAYDKAQAGVGVIVETKTGRSHFFDDITGCPYDQSCQMPSYLVPGDEVVIGKQQDGWMCVWYNGKSQEFVGWMPASAMVQTDWDRHPLADDWIGTWRYYDSGPSLTINSARQALSVEGEAQWRGGGSVVHFGSVSGFGVPEGNTLEISEGDHELDCHLTLTLLGENLVAEDNGWCGGMNVRFNGVFVREDP